MMLFYLFWIRFIIGYLKGIIFFDIVCVFEYFKVCVFFGEIVYLLFFFIIIFFYDFSLDNDKK